MSDVQNHNDFRGVLFNIAKNFANYAILLFPVEGRNISSQPVLDTEIFVFSI